MAGLSISGLVSNMDTATIIDQLMAVEANPQTLLAQRLSRTQQQVTAYRDVNSRVDALRTAAEKLAGDSAWQSVKATSSSTAVSASATTGAAPGSLSFRVDWVAKAHSVISTQKWTATDQQTAADLDFGAATIDVEVGGTTHTITVDRNGDGRSTLAEAAAAITARSDLGLSATAVRTSPTEYQLQVTSTRTGEASRFGVGAPDTFTTVTRGANAQLTVGEGTGYKVTSATNTFTGLLDGVTLTVTEPAGSVTVQVATDPEAIADHVQALVTSANALLDAISTRTDSTSSTAVLKGDSALRQLASRVLDVLSFAVGEDGSSSAVGLELTQNGRYTFDETAFLDELAADPAVVQRMFRQVTTLPGPDGDAATTSDNQSLPTGIAAKLADIARTASNTTDGTLTLLVRSTEERAKDLDERVEAWDLRLELRRTTLTRQFTAMETALGTLRNQASWLSSQLSSLSSS
ncbi:flagellar filament capping protein FliD [Geodermatophilus sp. SYSU D00698]